MDSRRVRSLILFAGVLGLVVSIFAAFEFYEASLRAVCSVSSFFSCATVDQSGKTSTLGIPDYLWGIGGFVVILGAASLADRRPNETAPAYFLLLVTTLGVATAVYFLYVELAEIHAVCLVCTAAYAFGGLAWAGAVGLVLRLRAVNRAGADDRDSA